VRNGPDADIHATGYRSVRSGDVSRPRGLSSFEYTCLHALGVDFYTFSSNILAPVADYRYDTPTPHHQTASSVQPRSVGTHHRGWHPFLAPSSVTRGPISSLDSHQWQSATSRSEELYPRRSPFKGSTGTSTGMGDPAIGSPSLALAWAFEPGPFRDPRSGPSRDSATGISATGWTWTLPYPKMVAHRDRWLTNLTELARSFTVAIPTSGAGVHLWFIRHSTQPPTSPAAEAITYHGWLFHGTVRRVLSHSPTLQARQAATVTPVRMERETRSQAGCRARFVVRETGTDDGLSFSTATLIRPDTMRCSARL